jgi:NAD(P)H dehydrogenase (quinone)
MYKQYKDAMKVHIVFVHELHKSFNGALLDVAVKALKDAGHEVTVSDLYAMKFNPVLSQADIRGKLRL